MKIRALVPDSVSLQEAERQASLVAAASVLSRMDISMPSGRSSYPAWQFMDLLLLPPQFPQAEAHDLSRFTGMEIHEVEVADETVAELLEFPNRL